MKSIKISIIIPVYNAEATLSECLDSILYQNYDNIEIIIINDGSTDNSKIIAEKYLAKDKRVKVFHKSNAGVSSARNFGIKKANGEWMTFVDSDDVLGNGFFDLLKKGNGADLIFADVRQIDLKGNDFLEFHHQDCYVGLKDAIEKHNILVSGDLHSKMFRSSIIKNNNLFFDESIHYSEDRLFFDTYLVSVNKIMLSSIVGYLYVRNSKGLSYRLNSYDSELRTFILLKQCFELISDRTGILVDEMLHDNPMKRVLFASKRYSFSEFKKRMRELFQRESYFFMRCLKNAFNFNKTNIDNSLIFIYLMLKCKCLKMRLKKLKFSCC